MIALICLIVSALGDTNAPWSLLGFSGYSGEITMNAQTGSSFFFWQFNALKGNISTDTRPLIIWSQGGPGCSSEIGMLGERISPIYIDDNMVPHASNSTWTTQFHLLSIDFPFGTGFSYASQPSDLQNSTVTAVNYLYNFLQILGVKYPSFFKRDVYWFGEDYAGHFIPAIVTKILSSNADAGKTGAVVIPIKGIGMGDPWIDASYQTQYYNTYMYNLGLVNIQQAATLSGVQTMIGANITSGNYAAASQSFNQALGLIEGYTGNVDIYNMRYYAQQDLGNLFGWLNLASTKTALNIPPAATWELCNSEVQGNFNNDAMETFATGMMTSLLSSIKVLIYHGQDDLYCNTLGINSWLSSLNWSQMPNFLASRRALWNVQGQLAGYVQTYSNLTYAQVLNAGNQGALNQPFATRDMAFRFILNQGWN